jgi:hypothetical protein
MRDIHFDDVNINGIRCACELQAGRFHIDDTDVLLHVSLSDVSSDWQIKAIATPRRRYDAHVRVFREKQGCDSSDTHRFLSCCWSLKVPMNLMLSRKPHTFTYMAYFYNRASRCLSRWTRKYSRPTVTYVGHFVTDEVGIFNSLSLSGFDCHWIPWLLSVAKIWLFFISMQAKAECMSTAYRHNPITQLNWTVFRHVLN